MDINLSDYYFERIHGYFTDLRVDSRWILRNSKNNQPYGSLRIVSHPDLKPGYLRAIFSYVTSIKKKTDNEVIRNIQDNLIDLADIETIDLENHIDTETKIIELTFRELSELFGVKIL